MEVTKIDSTVKTAEPEPSPEEVRTYLRALAELIYDVCKENKRKTTTIQPLPHDENKSPAGSD